MIKSYSDYNNEFSLRNQEKSITGLLKTFIYELSYFFFSYLNLDDQNKNSSDRVNDF